MYFMISWFGSGQERVQAPQTLPKKGHLEDLSMVSTAVLTVCNKVLLQDICCATYIYLMIKVKTYKVDKLSSP